MLVFLVRPITEHLEMLVFLVRPITEHLEILVSLVKRYLILVKFSVSIHSAH